MEIPDPSKEDALATLRFAILDAMASNSHIHRMEPDRAQLLTQEILASIFRPSTRWVLKALADDKEGVS